MEHPESHQAPENVYGVANNIPVELESSRVAQRTRWIKRWRVKAYKKVFVIEPNLNFYEDARGLRPFTVSKNREQDAQVISSSKTTTTNVNTDQNTHSDDPETLEEDFQTQSLMSEGPPELLLFRENSDIIEVPHSSHLSRQARQSGALECVVQMDAFLGLLHLRNRRFLVLAVGSDIVATLPPDCSPLGVPQDESEESIQKSLLQCQDAYAGHRHIHALSKVLIIPFHIPTNVFLSVKLKIDTSKPLSNTPPSHMPSSATRVRSTSNNPVIVPSEPKLPHTSRHPQASRLASIHRKAKSQDPASGHKHHVDQKLPDIDWAMGSISMEDLLGELASYVSEIEKNLSRRSYFYSYDLDLTRSLQNQLLHHRKTGRLALSQPVPVWGQLYGKRDRTKYPSLLEFGERHFIWNRHFCKQLEDFNIDRNWLVPVIQGSVSSALVNFGTSLLRMVLIGRRSSGRGGTRYFARGINHNGDVANFCESEFLANVIMETSSDSDDIRVPKYFPASSLEQSVGGWMAFVQVRGSIPLYWEQNAFGINPAPRITGNREANQKAFIKHQHKLEEEYGHVYYLDLLSSTKTGEARLSEGLSEVMESQKHHEGENLLKDTDVCTNSSFTYFSWDFHTHVQQCGFETALKIFNLRHDIQGALGAMEYLHTKSGKMQKGVFRTNCLDCLDRTNVMQWFLCQLQMTGFLHRIGAHNIVEASGIKCNQEYYASLVRDSEDVGQIVSFARGNRPTVYDPVNQKRSNSLNPKRWDLFSPLKLPPPLPLTAVMVNFTSLPPTREIRSYFIGGWSDDSLSITFYRTHQNYPVIKPAANTTPYLEEFKRSGAVHLWASHPAEEPTDAEGNVSVGVPITHPATDHMSSSTLVLRDAFSTIWADLGDLISVAYSGTGSVLSPLMKSGKSTIFTNIAHIRRSVGRLYKHNFEDRLRQECLDMILGHHRLSTARVFSSGSIEDFKGESIQSESQDDVGELPLSDFQAKIWAGTWNIGGGNNLNSEDLTHWLIPNESIGYSDIYAIALQEIVELTNHMALLNQVNRIREQEAITSVRRCLQDAYALLAVRTMVGIHLAIFVRSTMLAEISEVDTLESKMGFMGGAIGNKGAVLIRFIYKHRTWCFGAAHLAPDKYGDKYNERTAQLEKILSLTFPQSLETVRRHDYIFIGGDFNFPTMASVSEIERWLNIRDFEELFRHDQLNWMRQKKIPICSELLEAPICFWPTYKYKPRTSQYDRRRPPSWCDRVLYGGQRLLSQGDGLEFIISKYDRVRAFHSSDHKPVYLACVVSEFDPALDVPVPKIGVSTEKPDFPSSSETPVQIVARTPAVTTDSLIDL